VSLFETIGAREGLVTVAARLRAAREAATPTQAELAARAHVTGPKPPRGITPAELGARYDRARGAAPGTTSKSAVARWEGGCRVPTPEARRLLERALGLPKGSLDGAEEKSTGDPKEILAKH
jgi:transcriptional regulator with XRE-family HTH domain